MNLSTTGSFHDELGCAMLFAWAMIALLVYLVLPKELGILALLAVLIPLIGLLLIGMVVVELVSNRVQKPDKKNVV